MPTNSIGFATAKSRIKTALVPLARFRLYTNYPRSLCAGELPLRGRRAVSG